MFGNKGKNQTVIVVRKLNTHNKKKIIISADPSLGVGFPLIFSTSCFSKSFWGSAIEQILQFSYQGSCVDQALLYRVLELGLISVPETGNLFPKILC